MDYSSAESAFHRSFPKGFIRCTDFHRHFNGYWINVALELEIPTTPEKDFDEAWRLFRALLLWLRDNQSLFGSGDRFGIVTGWPENLKKRQRQIIKGGIANQELLAQVTDSIDSSTFVRKGGSFQVVRGWDNEVY